MASSFLDYAKIFVKAGKGGDGMVAFLREKYRPDGGPAGGDGGRGGSVIFKVDEGLRTLLDFRYNRHFKAQSGENGMPKGMYGRGADDLYVSVPPGTTIRDAATNQVLADLVDHGEECVVAKGGRGGRGNIKFATQNNPAPEIAENGEPGQERELILELKLIADAGLIGFPSVGKSTLLSIVSAAKPKIGDYHFTTLSPNLGVVRPNYGEDFVLADLPGLIEGAAEGVGLGIRFLRHVERTKVILHVVDMGAHENRDPFDDYVKINKELLAYDETLLERPTVIVANKMDIPEGILYLEEFKAKLADYFASDHPDLALPEIFPISAYQKEGIDDLVNRIAELVSQENERLAQLAEEEAAQATDQVQLYTLAEEEPEFYIDRDPDGVFVLSGDKIEKSFKMANLEYDESALRFARHLKRIGVDQALVEAGAQEGDIVRILDYEFEFFD
ncbi:GTPase ObgE [Aerococcus urinaehominis]|uniref:GTPase Obg n=1 Tax=Aerococcus urinaehominis TaxID=128944 RepID=A0A0X8FKY1_9LACT|nr:GTPase ObgE [Aerococcus urinaehominis]AMB98527.1 GTPase ObgE [Aerococcus urinaehominis]SDL79376.1 GTP-binding protein [Aerococcus urinaehominis]